MSLSLQFALQRSRPPRTAPRCPGTRWRAGSATRWTSDAEITVRIVDAEEGQALNRDYRHKDYATNVLTFDYDETPLMRRPGAVRAGGGARGAEQRKNLQAHYAHLIVHGSLHAQGWDHETGEADAREMEARETRDPGRTGVRQPLRLSGSLTREPAQALRQPPERCAAESSPVRH